MDDQEQSTAISSVHPTSVLDDLSVKPMLAPNPGLEHVFPQKVPELAIFPGETVGGFTVFPGGPDQLAGQLNVGTSPTQYILNLF